MSFSDLDNLCINTIRCLAPDIVQKAKSGHPGEYFLFLTTNNRFAS